MHEHASALVLDELAAGLEVEPTWRRHLEQCARCQGKLLELRAYREQLTASERYEAAFARLRARSSPPRRAFFLPAAVLSAALAAAALLFVWPPQQGRGAIRLKGGAAVTVLSAPSGAPISSARPGDRVVLSVDVPPGYPFCLVIGVDEAGGATQLWPSGAAKSAALPSGRATALEPGFVVTPGSLVVAAFFSRAPLDGRALRRGLERELEAVPPPDVIRAKTVLRVGAGR